jgi:hypothetical protein
LPAKKVTPKKVPKKKGPAWSELPPKELAAYLQERVTIPDSAWTDQPRRKDETRSALIDRVLFEGDGEPRVIGLERSGESS